MKSNKSKQFREIAFLLVINFFLSSKIDIWPFLKLQKMELGQKKIVKLVYLISRVFLAWTFLNFLAYYAVDRQRDKFEFVHYYLNSDTSVIIVTNVSELNLFQQNCQH